MAAPDMELKAAFAELQSKVIENKQKMKFHDIQIENLKRSITHSTLTDTEIAQLPKDTKVKFKKEIKCVKKNLFCRFMRVLAECFCCLILPMLDLDLTRKQKVSRRRSMF